MKRMRQFSKEINKFNYSVGRVARLGKWLSVAALSSAVLVGCSSNEDEVPYGSVGHVTGFYGAVSGDEPASVLLARNILTSGGNAADAAVALGFSMAVTYQAETSLASGGVCLVHDGQNGTTEVLDFLGRPATGKTGQYKVAIPGFVRGMAALNLQYGTVEWKELLSPAEQQARFGHRLSRAMDRKIQGFKGKLAQDLESRKKFTDDKGQIYREGQKIGNPELAVTLGRIRLGGAGQFYVGEFARNFVKAAQANGANLTVADMKNYLPTWRGAVSVTMDEKVLYTTPLPSAGGLVTSSMWELYKADDAYDDRAENPQALDRLTLDAAKAALAYRAEFIKKNGLTMEEGTAFPETEKLAAHFGSKTQSSPIMVEGTSGASFLVVDRYGLAVACNLGLNDHFGTGRMIPEYGFYLASAPTVNSVNSFGFGPVIVARGQLEGAFLYGATASGGRAAAQILSKVTADTLIAEKSLKDAVGDARFFLNEKSQIVMEPSLDSTRAKALKASGLPQMRGDIQTRVHAIHCPETLPVDDDGVAVCETANDSRGYGLAATLLPQS